MVGILLTILKIIGITLLAILGFVLLLLILVLFVPFVYTVRGLNEDGIEAHIKVTWLGFLLSVSADYKEKLILKARVLGIRVWGKGDRPEKASADGSDAGEFDANDEFEDLDDLEGLDDLESSENPGKSEALDKLEGLGSSGNSDSLDNSELTESLDGFKKSDNTENGSGKQTESNEAGNATYGCKTEDSSSEEFSSEDSSSEDSESDITGADNKKSIFSKISDLFDKVLDFITELPFKLDEVSDKPEEAINNIVDTYIYYDRILNSPGTEYVITFLKKHILPILKNIRPRKSKIFIDYESDDPVSVAKAYEAYGYIYPFMPKRTNIVINFGESKFVFNIWIRGHVTLGCIAYHGLLIVFNRKVKTFLNKMKREK